AHFVSLLGLFGVQIPASLTAPPTQWCTAAQAAAHVAGCAHPALNLTGAVINLPAVLIVALMSAVLVIGIRESARVNSVIVILKVAIVLLVVLVSLSHIDRANWTPFIPPNTGEWGTYGWSGVLRGAGLVFFAYIGFDTVSTAAQESKNPQRDMPIGILGSLAVCTLLYVVVSAGGWILRSKRPDLHRPFRTPWVPVVPILGILCCFGLMLTLPADTWIRLAAWLAIGLAIYWSYGRKHSRLRKGV